MLESILGWMISQIANACGPVVDKLADIVDMGIDFFAELFPHASTLYGVLQGIALGFAVAIAAINLLKFFLTASSERAESPIRVVVRMFFAVGLIFFGGYILEFIVDIFKGPFSSLLDAGSITRATLRDLAWSELAGEILVGSGIATGAKLLVEFIAMIVLIVNVFKFVLELCERWMMVGVMVYTAPLGFCTIASQATAGIFTKWWQMVLSTNIMMLISAWSLRMLMDILISPSEIDMFTKIIFAMAFCRVAQRFDSYIQQMGLSVATTSGSMLSEITGAAGAMIAGTKMFGKGKGGDSGSRDATKSDADVLGAKDPGSAKGFGLVGAATFGAAGFVGAKLVGTGANIVSSGAAGFKRGFKDTFEAAATERASGSVAVGNAQNLGKKVLSRLGDGGKTAWEAVKNGGAQMKDNVINATPGHKGYVQGKMDTAYNRYNNSENGYDSGLTLSEKRALDERIRAADKTQQRADAAAARYRAESRHEPGNTSPNEWGTTQNQESGNTSGEESNNDSN